MNAIDRLHLLHTDLEKNLKIRPSTGLSQAEAQHVLFQLTIVCALLHQEQKECHSSAPASSSD